MFKKETNIRDLFAENEKPIQIVLKRRASQEMLPKVSVSPKLMEQPKLSVHVCQAQMHSPERKTYYLGELKTTKRKPLPHSNSITIKYTNLSTTLTTNQCNSYVGKINYTLKFVIGWGGFGKVWKVEHKRSRQIYAMKELQKAKQLGLRTQDFREEFSKISVKREEFTLEVETSIYSKYSGSIPRQRDIIFSNGLSFRRRFKISFDIEQIIQRRLNKIFYGMFDFRT
ncbi:unnamed protein product [Paramecium sonneborni]|uniref:Protein kinase domain-containing protein n=1 Tax=Paramecium sonneborni TaxID=65129 RepID=A0A8S1QVD8_9CILI|nr:unnamed protein product [Paramecium sonneborni]